MPRIGLLAVALCAPCLVVSSAGRVPINTAGTKCISAYGNITRRASGFWIAAASVHLDRETLALVGCRASIIVLNAPEGRADGDKYALRELIKRIHLDAPGVPVVSYAWATRWYRTTDVGGTTLNGFDQLGNLLIRDQQGTLASLADGALLADPRSAAYRSWFEGRVKESLARTGADGVSLDVVTAAPPAPALKAMRGTPGFARDYAAGVADLLKGITSSLRPRTVIFNGLWNRHPGMLAEQEALLPNVHAAAVEFFARDYAHAPSFVTDVLAYLQVIARHPEVRFLVFGRGARDPAEYRTYRDDYLWQRYAFGAYLLGVGPNTSFKYHATFVLNPSAGRNDGLSVFADGDLDLGLPQGAYSSRNNLYVRKFANGIVVVAAPEGPQQTFTLGRVAFTPEGATSERTIALQPGTAAIRTWRMQTPTETSVIYFDALRVERLGWEWASASSASPPFLHLSATPVGRRWEHDLLLDPVRRLHPFDSLIVHYRTTDPEARFGVSVEVDDQLRKNYYCALRTSVSALAGHGNREQSLSFRSSSPRPGDNIELPGLLADGAWHSFVVNGQRATTADPSCAFRRFDFLRMEGRIDVQSVALGYVARAH